MIGGFKLSITRPCDGLSFYPLRPSHEDISENHDFLMMCPINEHHTRIDDAENEHKENAVGSDSISQISSCILFVVKQGECLCSASGTY